MRHGNYDVRWNHPRNEWELVHVLTEAHIAYGSHDELTQRAQALDEQERKQARRRYPRPWEKSK